MVLGPASSIGKASAYSASYFSLITDIVSVALMEIKHENLILPIAESNATKNWKRADFNSLDWAKGSIAQTNWLY